MEQYHHHDWDIDVKAMDEIQKSLSQKIITKDCFDPIEIVVGVDAAYDEISGKAVAAAVAIDANSLEIREESIIETKVDYQYIPGYLSFRELPSICQALENLKTKADLIVTDSQGLAHPRRFGLACHLGILFDKPTIGCAKNHLIGLYDVPDRIRGCQTPLIDNGEVIGACLRTQTDVKPLFVSIGHKISLHTACDWVLKLAPSYRLPETTRASDHLVRQTMKSIKL
ncbi:deoxyribonuclease V [Bartonella sp. HY329]|uniref:deoxyribonuclease V n=1 Tax=unclassified Bartonella TaxID=2645622 RepID=UPI0021CA07B5|nr:MULTISPECIES: deoxyribonuclease V [unclassified Bartonella]UXM94730.1 deoxyribonuclease V [Bartonella sp. HY329]UXN09053.1 deoxyribonuclease V [Bartonella sp. HY328]